MKFKTQIPVDVEIDIEDVIKQYILNIRVPKTYEHQVKVSNIIALLNIIKAVAASPSVGIDIKYEVD